MIQRILNFILESKFSFFEEIEEKNKKKNFTSPLFHLAISQKNYNAISTRKRILFETSKRKREIEKRKEKKNTFSVLNTKHSAREREREKKRKKKKMKENKENERERE